MSDERIRRSPTSTTPRSHCAPRRMSAGSSIDPPFRSRRRSAPVTTRRLLARQAPDNNPDSRRMCRHFSYSRPVFVLPAERRPRHFALSASSVGAPNPQSRARSSLRPESSNNVETRCGSVTARRNNSFPKKLFLTRPSVCITYS